MSMSKQPGRPEKKKIKCKKVEIDLAGGKGHIWIDGKEVENVVEVKVIGRVCEVPRVLLNLRPKEILIRINKGCEVVKQDDPKQAAQLGTKPGGRGGSIATVTER